MILDLWENVSACAAVDVDANGVPMHGQAHRHFLRLAQVASETTLASKRAAYAAELAKVRPGCCPHCWRRGKAIPAATPEACPMQAQHPGAAEASR